MSRRPAPLPRLAAALFALTVIPMLSAAHTPGASATSPDVAAEPRPLFLEDFEQAPDDGHGTSLRDYLGANGQRYGSDDFWADRAACNGFIASAGTTTDLPGDCLDRAGAAAQVRALAGVLGIVNGSEPTTNSAVAAHTELSGPDRAIEFETLTPVDISGSTGRFVTFSVNAAAVNCAARTPPLLRFSLSTETGPEIPVSEQAIDPCSDPRGSEIAFGGMVARAGSFASDGSHLLTGDAVRIIMRNEHGDGLGNDHAFDDIRILDVTPSLDVSSDRSVVAAGDTVRLSFAVHNTSELAAKDGWSAAFELPDGLRLPDDPRPGTTCPTTALQAAPGGRSITISGDLPAGRTECTFSLDVAATTAVSASFSASAATRAVGLGAGASAQVRFGAPLVLEQPAADAIVDTTRPEFAGTGEASAAIVVSDAEERVLCETTVRADGGWSCVALAELTHGDTSATARQTFSGTTSQVTVAYRVVVPASALDALVEVQQRTPGDAWTTVSNGRASVTVGDELRVVASVTNAGDTAIDDLGAVDTPQTAIRCDATSLAPGASTVCTSSAPLTLTHAMIDSGRFTHELEATAFAAAPGGVPSLDAVGAATPSGRLPEPERPIATSGLQRTEVSLTWSLAPLDPSSPLVRTGTDPLATVLLIASPAVLVGVASLVIGVLRRRRAARSTPVR